MKRVFEAGLALTGLAAITGCAAGDMDTGNKPPPGLTAYVSSKGYQPLQIARAKWGPGTVVSFSRGNENIVMFNEQCAKFTDADVQKSSAALPQVSYSSDRTIGADLGLEKGVIPNIDVSSAFKDQRVKKIKVTVGKAEEQVASDITVATRVKALLANNENCAQMLLQKGNYVIDDALVLGDTSFSFLGTADTTVKLDASLLKAIKIGGNLAQKLEGKSELSITEPMIVGYKLYALEAKNGAVGTDIVVRLVGPEELATLKTAR